MKILVIVNGFPRSGKDTFIDLALRYLWQGGLVYADKHSTIDSVKDFAKEMGWNGEKTPEMRNFLSELKDLYTKYFDGPLNEIKEQLESDDVLFTCMREPKEIERTVEWAKENGIYIATMLVRRPETEERNHGSHSDRNVLDYDYQVIVENTEGFEELAKKAKEFADFILTYWEE